MVGAGCNVHTMWWPPTVVRRPFALPPAPSRGHSGCVDRASFCGRGGKCAARTRLATDLFHQPTRGRWGLCALRRIVHRRIDRPADARPAAERGQKRKSRGAFLGGVVGEVGARPGVRRRPPFSYAGGGKTKVSGLFSRELISAKMSSWEDQDVPTQRAGFITP
jgi:hypothetical protein